LEAILGCRGRLGVNAGVTGPSPAAIAASIGDRKRQERHHDVSFQTGATAGGWYLGLEPRAKTSMIIMRPAPQKRRGQRLGRAYKRPASTILSVRQCSLMAASVARAVASLAALHNGTLVNRGILGTDSGSPNVLSGNSF
jgi:hypothetical protein